MFDKTRFSYLIVNFVKSNAHLATSYSGQQETVTAPLGKCHLDKPRVLSPLRERSGLSTPLPCEDVLKC